MKDFTSKFGAAPILSDGASEMNTDDWIETAHEWRQVCCSQRLYRLDADRNSLKMRSLIVSGPMRSIMHERESVHSPNPCPSARNVLTSGWISMRSAS